jgi:hypothetical protein
MADGTLSVTTGSASYDYLLSPSAWVAVFIPALLSLLILAWYIYAGRFSSRLQLVWIGSMPITLFCARWDYSNDLHQLYLYSAFSVACLILLFKRMYISPLLAYALSFLSLFLVDFGEAFAHAIQWRLPLATFYYGVGGAGVMDALFIVPALTALAVAYGAIRLKGQHPILHEF